MVSRCGSIGIPSDTCQAAHFLVQRSSTIILHTISRYIVRFKAFRNRKFHGGRPGPAQLEI
ncbi:unnamed protein product [Moneuplotes crassus]|uniref:Uncharacterized protein n=1 Tax=Euplotes crassus TaxID=5936 RepID=A0AAD2CYF2_EUPCR|nr:unnamed protein product [Moneuplotes crassus]